MHATVDVSTMPVTERLRLMESLWDSLSGAKNADEAIPAWHADVLTERLVRLGSGDESSRAWAEAKEEIRQQARVR